MKNSAEQARPAAGAVCWRYHRTGIQVLLVHRPKYHDWSYPKGKLERGEQLHHCAVREVFEETGVRITLGPSLPITRYTTTTGALKTVQYWLASPRAYGARTAPETEIDDARWVSLEQAEQLLTFANDRDLLALVAEADRSGTLTTVPFVVVPARAARSSTQLLSNELQLWHPHRVLCTPAGRGQLLIQTYLVASQADLVIKKSLGNDKRPHRLETITKHFTTAIREEPAVAVCADGQGLSAAITVLRDWSDLRIRPLIGITEPHLHPRELLIAHCVRQPRETTPRVISVEHDRY